jgi:GABA permease
MRNYLVVANQTLAGEHLLDLLRERVAEGPCRFYLVVPATRVRAHLLHTEGEAKAAAQHRLDEALAQFSALGMDVDGEVGGSNALDSIAEVVAKRACDEIILSTLPPGPSVWLHQDLPRRIERRFGLPLTHVFPTPVAAESN